MTEYAVLLSLVVIQITVGIFGAYAGYTSGGVARGIEVISLEGLNPVTVVTWVVESGRFMFSMLSFQVDGMPVPVNAIFVVMGIMTIFIILKLVRGS